MARVPERLPTVWMEAQLDRDRTRAIGDFVKRRLDGGDPEYAKQYDESRLLMTELFARSDQLRRLDAERFADRQDLITDIARFVAGPPVSLDDFHTLLKRRKAQLSAQDLAPALRLIAGLVDRKRFPWVHEKRKPTLPEEMAATVATACLRAVERVRTVRRGAEKVRQEDGVCSALRGARLQEVARVKRPDHDLPPGSFVHGASFEGKQCDVLVRLYDERFLGIECKSSNSAVNSIKRLNDVADKASVWKKARGAKVVTAAVLAGVFDLAPLEQAQRKDVYIWWEHDLKPMCKYVRSTQH